MQTTLLLVLAVAVAVVHAAPQQEQVPNPDTPTLKERRSPVAEHDDKAKDAGKQGGSEAQGGAEQTGDKTSGEADNAKGTAAFRPAREVLVAQEPENPPPPPPTP